MSNEIIMYEIGNWWIGVLVYLIRTTFGLFLQQISFHR